MYIKKAYCIYQEANKYVLFDHIVYTDEYDILETIYQLIWMYILSY